MDRKEPISLKAARVNRKYTQQEMSRLLNITVKTYNKFENSPSKMSVEMCQQICNILNMNKDDIIFLP